MKKYLLIINLIAISAFAAPMKKDINIYFNPAKLTSELKGDATIFKYKHPECKYVVHEPGAPVLPCMQVYVLMPKGAMYNACSIRAKAQPLRGDFKLYCRRFVYDTAFTAKRYPPKLAEFVEQKDINGYRVFVFRTYPISCQPGDNSVKRILQTSLSIKYYVPEDSDLYECNSSKSFDEIKRLVLNPYDLDELSSVRPERSNSNVNRRDTINNGTFATKIEKKISDKKPDVAVKTKRSAFNEFMEDKLSIDDNDVVYSPIAF